jgi:hypothetical protein
VPGGFVVGTGKHSGATEDEMKRVSVFATVPCNHLQILRKATGTVIAAIDKVAAARS